MYLYSNDFRIFCNHQVKIIKRKKLYQFVSKMEKFIFIEIEPMNRDGRVREDLSCVILYTVMMDIHNTLMELKEQKDDLF